MLLHYLEEYMEHSYNNNNKHEVLTSEALDLISSDQCPFFVLFCT